MEASREPPTQPEEDHTSTSTDNHEWNSPGRKGHIADGSDTGRLKKDSTRTKPKSRTDLLPYAALNQSTSLIDAEEWPQLPGPGAQDLHGPTLQPLAMSQESPAETTMAPPIALHQQVQKQQETAIDSTEQATISSEETGMANHGATESITNETAINVPEAGQPTTATSTLTRRQRSARSNRPPKSSTACFSYDTLILTVSQGIALWKMFYQVQKGEAVVQSLPSDNIMDLNDALITPIKTVCIFETQEGGNDMVNLGTSLITPHHHIRTAEGWMTALQAVDKSQGRVYRSMHPRVYNLCVEGGGNILINTSNQPGEMIFTPAATMGYLFTPAPDSQQNSSLSYPEDIQTQLGLRQDLSYGYAQFWLGDVETLPNGQLIFDNITGDMPKKKPRTPLLDKSPGAERLRQPDPKLLTNLNKTQTSDAPDQGNREKSISVSSKSASSCSPLTDTLGGQAHLGLGNSQLKSKSERATRGLESSSATANRNPHPQKNLGSDATIPPPLDGRDPTGSNCSTGTLPPTTLPTKTSPLCYAEMERKRSTWWPPCTC